jgi:hypothetical protein
VVRLREKEKKRRKINDKSPDEPLDETKVVQYWYHINQRRVKDSKQQM